MSDREDMDNRDMQSPVGSMSDRSEGERKIVTYRSRSKDRTGGSRTPSPSHKGKRKYSRSRSRSRSHHKSSGGGRRSSRYRSRSRSPRRYKSSRYSRSRSPTRSRSGSESPYRSGGRRYRSHSRSPMSNRRRHNGSRVNYETYPENFEKRKKYENPAPSRCLGVFGLSIYTTEQQIHHIFSKFGPVERVQVVIDAKTGRSRGFCFVYFENYEDARVAKDQCTGMEIDGRKIRVDYSITQRAHTPTPGIYMGKPTYTDDRWRRGGDRDYNSDYYSGSYRSYRRSPSPYYRRGRRYERSRSRSYTPRRY